MARRWLVAAVLVIILTPLLARVLGAWVWTVAVFAILISYPVLILVLGSRHGPS